MSELNKEELEIDELEGVSGGLDSATRKFGKKVGDKIKDGAGSTQKSVVKANGKAAEKSGVIYKG